MSFFQKPKHSVPNAPLSRLPVINTIGGQVIEPNFSVQHTPKLYHDGGDYVEFQENSLKDQMKRAMNSVLPSVGRNKPNSGEIFQSLSILHGGSTNGISNNDEVNLNVLHTAASKIIKEKTRLN